MAWRYCCAWDRLQKRCPGRASKSTSHSAQGWRIGYCFFGRGLDSGAAGQGLDGRECRWRPRGSATIGSPPMVEHVSPEGFLGGVLFGALVVWLAAYLIWGKGRNATKVQLLAAQANEAAAQASERATL